MKQNNHGHTPTKLVDTQNSIRRNVYVLCVVMRAFYLFRNEMDSLVVEFRVTKGRYKDFMLKAEFSQTYKSRRRLSFLCNSIGIYDELQSPDQLVARLVRIRLVLFARNYKGKQYTGYRISGFFPVDRGTDMRENCDRQRYMRPTETLISEI
jgi:hypothetical protein